MAYQSSTASHLRRLESGWSPQQSGSAPTVTHRLHSNDIFVSTASNRPRPAYCHYDSKDNIPARRPVCEPPQPTTCPAVEPDATCTGPPVNMPWHVRATPRQASFWLGAPSKDFLSRTSRGWCMPANGAGQRPASSAVAMSTSSSPNGSAVTSFSRTPGVATWAVFHRVPTGSPRGSGALTVESPRGST